MKTIPFKKDSMYLIKSVRHVDEVYEIFISTWGLPDTLAKIKIEEMERYLIENNMERYIPKIEITSRVEYQTVIAGHYIFHIDISFASFVLRQIENKIREIVEWIDQETIGTVEYWEHGVTFENNADAVMFTLRFGQEVELCW